VIVGLLTPNDHLVGSAQQNIRSKSVAGGHGAAARPAVIAPRRQEPRTAEPAHLPPPTARQVAAAAATKANELGMVPVFMYHRILPKPEDPLDRSLQQFRAEVTRLADEGYVPVTAADYVAGRIDVPAGRHPVVLTFDDAHPSHLTFDAAGNPRGDTAIGILFEVARGHPGFRPVATMYLNKDPFMMGPHAARGLRWLLRHGFELGNHTANHPNLSRMSKGEIRKEIGGDQKLIRDLAGVDATTFAYPFGALPEERSWVMRGEAEGAEWDFKGSFLAGWMPAPSPYDKDFDPQQIPRIRSEDKIKEAECTKYCSTAWLDWLRDHPRDRYTSDGDPARIAFPESEEDRLPKKLTEAALPY
jgi:peptidoglycan/xylan/chitin deacetylase (PgdA/CDA1 family)